VESADRLKAVHDLAEQIESDHLENPADVGQWLCLVAELLSDPDLPDPTVTEFTLLGRLIHEDAYRPSVLNWIATQNDAINEDVRGSMEVAFLEPLPEDPVSDDVLEAIWLHFWPTRGLQWVVWSCYGTVPEKFESDHSRYRQRASERGIAFPVLDVAEYQKWWGENAV
jgi:hypothetical protein